MSFIDKITKINRSQQNQKNILDELQNSKLPLLLWGMGGTANYVIDLLKNNNIGLSGVFVDDYYPPKNLKFHNLEVLTIEDICQKYKKYNVISGHSLGALYSDKLKMNVENINNVYNFDLAFLYSLCNIDYDYILKNKDSFEWTYNQLLDELSKESYITYLNAKIDIWTKKMNTYVCEKSYFCDDIINLTENETLVDCGAHNGDTIKSFVKDLNNRFITKYNSIYAFEPDETNYSRLLELKKEIPNLYCIKKGAWNEKTILRFNAGKGELSTITNSGTDAIEVDTIDNILQSQKVTMIKMDVEGAELNALKGAEQTILNNRPKLAICIYHNANDLITIPQYIKSIIPEYNFYFRLHKYGTVDAVLYAV